MSYIQIRREWRLWTRFSPLQELLITKMYKHVSMRATYWTRVDLDTKMQHPYVIVLIWCNFTEAFLLNNQACDQPCMWPPPPSHRKRNSTMTTAVMTHLVLYFEDQLRLQFFESIKLMLHNWVLLVKRAVTSWALHCTVCRGPTPTLVHA